MQVARANPSTAQTDTSLIAAPGAGWQTAVYGIYVSSDTALTVTFEEGATTLWRQYVAAYGGELVMMPSSKIPLFDVSANTAVTYTTSAAGNVYIHVIYETKKG